MKKLIASVVLLTATVAFAQEKQLKALRNEVDANGASFVSGDLGRISTANPAVSARQVMSANKSLLHARGTEDFEAIGTFRDDRGETHVRMQERVNGLPVVGAEYVLHADADGNVFAMNGRFAPDANLPRNAELNAWTAIERAIGQASIENAAYDKWPRLTYVVNEKGNAFLAWSVGVAYTDADGEQRDIIYADATTGDLVLRAAQIQRARNRNTYTTNNSTTLPGTLVLTETGGSTTDATLQAAHNYAGTTYDYYYQVHGRDSFNNAGAQIKSTVHYSVNYNNAYWDGSQMVYGDGDGTQFAPLAKSFDVDAHELTHAVTQYSANLTYSNESGALNEATSDIMSAAAEAWKNGAVNSNTWKVGEDVYTPATAGDALRYMNDPAAGGDYDYYPTRYTGTSDNGGVHSNSGIANLAFYLMTMGGTHPRSKTTVVVPALNATATTSISMASKIWYRALTVYMTSSSGFSAARTATSKAATDLYGAAAADSVNKAWDAVGAPGGSTGSTTTVLSNGVAATGLSASTGAWKHFKIAVPTGQSKLDIVMSGGTGDGDLYVKFGAQPTSTSYDYRPYLSGNAESVSVTNPAAGDWYISIYAYATYSSVSLKATYSAASSCTSTSGSLSGTGATWYSAQYTSSVSGSHTGKLTGPASGADFDLYLEKWNGSAWASVAAGESATASESVTYSGTSGSYRWRVYAYSGSGSFTLCTSHP
ncbi:MAG: M4 family metallopeptidase [Acidobacteriota bacterium]|nr:M4 family metallopeptidase [Acidobacteriota bacterium]